MGIHATHVNLHYDDGSVITTPTFDTEIDNPAVYTATIADVSGASYASTLVYDAQTNTHSIVYASYDGKWIEELK